VGCQVCSNEIRKRRNLGFAKFPALGQTMQGVAHFSVLCVLEQDEIECKIPRVWRGGVNSNSARGQGGILQAMP
jgi:hypothetical protein